MNRQEWKSTLLADHSANAVPPASGVYVLLKVERTAGVPLRADPLYVGKTANLRRRLC